MEIPGWKYYNHAAIPSCAPHEEPDLKPVLDGSIWNMPGKPSLVRYTTDWDCGYDTGWWYLIKEAPFDLSSLSSNSRKHIKEAFRKTKVAKIDPTEYVDALYECSHQAFLKYKNAFNESSYECFKQSCYTAAKRKIEFWAGFDIVSGELIGWLNVKNQETWCEIVSAKFNPAYLKLRASDALYATVLDYYLNVMGAAYVSSGARSISHDTNSQEYKESHFGYRKVFCKLNIFYSTRLRIIINICYPFHKIITSLGKKIKRIHSLSALLFMEQIRRTFKEN